MIVMPFAEPTPPTAPSTRTIVTEGRVQAGVMRHAMRAALHVGSFRDRRGTNRIISYPFDELTRDPSADGDRVWAVPRLLSDRVRHLFVAVRVQTAQAKGGARPELAVRLLLRSDGSEIDKGFRWLRASLEHDADPDVAVWLPFWVQSGTRQVEGADAQTGPRLLNAGANQGEWVSVEVTARQARVLTVYTCEWPEAVVEQVFTP